MNCPKCESKIDNFDNQQAHVKCGKCRTVVYICRGMGTPHACRYNVSYCPVCGEELPDQDLASHSGFLFGDNDEFTADTLWEEQKDFSFSACGDVFPIAYDAFTIFIYDRGEYEIHSQDMMVKRNVLRIGDKDTILALLHGPRRIVFLAGPTRTLYSTSIAALFHNAGLERVSCNVSAFDYDPGKDTLAYAESGRLIMRSGSAEPVILTENGVIEHLRIKPGLLFYTTREDKDYAFKTCFLESNQQSRKTITFTDKPDLTLSASNRNHIATMIKKGNRAQLWAGSWSTIAHNSRNWNKVELSSSPNKMIIGNDDLIYLEYPNAIEVKDITSLTDGVRNKRREIPNLVPRSLCLSLDGRHISVAARATSTANFDSSKVFVLSQHLDSINSAAFQTPFLIHKYLWDQGHLVAIINHQGKFGFSREKI